MTKAEKKKFIRELMGSVEKTLLDKVEAVPESWDGHELRRWIADTVALQAVTGTLLTGRRWKDYQNEVLVRNLV